ncbi:MAG: response regulator [Pseudomonadota bacterium]
MNDELCVDLTAINRLFSVVVCANDKGEIVHASDTLKRYIPELELGMTLDEVFIMLRPAPVRSMEQLREHIHSLFLLKATNERFAVRGQVVETSYMGEPVLCFCGAPWLFWMNANCPDVKLGMGDFSAQDSQLDQLFLMTTEQRMVADLEKLNSDLKSAKKETEKAQDTKNALFARMSHEMRTPLNGVVSALSLLADKELPSEARRLLELAHSSSRNLLHVINYILDISKLESGEETIDNTVFALPRLLKSVTDIVRARAVEKELDLDWRISPQLSNMYVADKAKLRQCLLNLVTNAIKFTSEGSVIVRALPSALGKTGSVRFEVEDTGMGISEADQAKIFDPFWTSGESAPGKEEGTGLGLDIVRRNVEIMRGTMGVISRLGKGSLFWFEVPLEASDVDDMEAERESDIGAPIPNRFKGTVLLVDDNSTNLMLGRMILESLGLTIEEADDGSVAVEMVKEKRYDLVLMDISMPILDGVAATQSIRQHFGGDELPIVALTAYASNDERERCLAAGMNDYLTKPIVRDRLAEKIHRFLKTQDDGEDTTRKSQSIDPAKEPNGAPALAEEVLFDLRDQIGEANLGTVLDQFEKEVRSRWDSLKTAYDTEDVAAMTREAHTLSSTCRSLGLIAAGEHFSAMEERMRRKPRVPKDGLSESNGLLSRGLNALTEFRATQ